MGKFIDLTGQTINGYFVIKYLGKSYWRCKNLNTNEEETIHSYTLRNKGNLNKKTLNPRFKEDLTDRQFGELKVLEYVGGKNGRWKCQCSCGNIAYVSGFDLLNNRSTKCSNPIHKNKVDLTNQQINEWKVIGYAGNMRWHCKCSCGVEKDVLTKYLINGSSKSCGHDRNYHIIHKDITENQYGYLKVLGYTGNNQMWLCECLNCGKKVEVFRDSLVSGKTRSCGCLKETMRAQTLLERYGDTNTTRILNPREPWQLEVVSSKEKFEEYLKNLKSKPTVFELSQLLNIQETSVTKLLRKFDRTDLIQESNQISDLEISFLNYIKNIYNGEIIQSDRKILNGKELDIYIPDKKLAFEFNGDYWHSSIFKDDNYHQNKSIECIKKGIRLIHIFEYEWADSNTNKKLKNFIYNIFNKDIIIGARETVIKEINKEDCIEFLNKYHLQNYSNSSINIGCYYKDELIGVMTFGYPRFNADYQYEMIRLAWKYKYNVIGGSNKLFKYFINHYNPESILSYCDVSKFDGSVYSKIGFKLHKDIITKPNYVWVNKSRDKVLTRYQTNKQKLIEEGLDKFGTTEDEIMENLGYYKIYNSGNLKFEYIKE